MPNNYVSLSDILQQVTQQNTELGITQDQMNRSYGTVIDAAGNAAQSQLDLGEDKATVTATQSAGELAAQNNARMIATQLNMNPDVNADKIVQLSQQIAAEYDQANKALDVVHNKQSGSFWENPLGYISDQISVGQDIKEYNYHVRKHNLASDELDELNSLAQTSTRTQFAIAAVRDQASVEAKVKAMRDEANVAAQKTIVQGNLYNIDRLSKLQSLNQEQLDNSFKAYSAINADEARRFSEEQRLLARQEAEERLAMFRERAEQQKASKEEADNYISTVNEASTAMGLPPISAADIKLMYKSPVMKKRLDELYISGAAAKVTGQFSLGNSPAEAASILLQTKAPMSEASSQVKKLVTDSFSAIASGAALPPTADRKVLSNPAAVNQMVNDHINKVVTEQAELIKPGDNSNIYQAPPLKSVAENSVAVATSPLFQKVFKPTLSATDNFETNPEIITSQALAAVKGGVISYEDAVRGVSSIFQAAVGLNNTTKDYAKYNIAEQHTYPVMLTPATGFTRKFDLTDPTDVARYFALKQILPPIYTSGGMALWAAEKLGGKKVTGE